MGLFSENLKSFDDLYVMQLQDLYSAESQLVDALPQMAEAATHPELKQAFQQHLEVTQRQKQRRATGHDASAGQLLRQQLAGPEQTNPQRLFLAAKLLRDRLRGKPPEVI